MKPICIHNIFPPSSDSTKGEYVSYDIDSSDVTEQFPGLYVSLFIIGEILSKADPGKLEFRVFRPGRIPPPAEQDTSIGTGFREGTKAISRVTSVRSKLPFGNLASGSIFVTITPESGPEIIFAIEPQVV